MMATRTISAAGGNSNVAATYDENLLPTASDDIVCRGDGTSGSFVVAATLACRSADFTNYPNTSTVSGSSAWNIGTSTAGPGNVALKLVAGMGFTYSGAITYVGTSATAQTLTTATKAISSSSTLGVNGAGGTLTLLDTFNGSTAGTSLVLTNGTLNINGQTVTAFNFTVTSNSNTRVLAMGTTGSVTLAKSAAWATGTVTNFTTTGSGTITFTANIPIFAGGGANYSGTTNGITVAFTGGGAGSITGANTFGNLSFIGTAIKTDALTLSADQTVGGTLTLSGEGTTGNRLLVQSSVKGTPRTITCNGTVTAQYADFADITGAGSASWDLHAITGNSGDCQGNSGITFTTPATQTYTGGADNWSTAARWTSRIPLPQDDVVVTSPGASSQVTIDMPRIGHSIDFTGFTHTLVQSVATVLYGNLTMPSTMTPAVTGTSVTLAGRSSQTVTIQATLTGQEIYVNAVGGTYTLGAALATSRSTNSALQVLSGTFTVTTQNLTFSGASGGFTMTGGTLNMGSGTWTFSGTNAYTVWNVAGGTVNASTSIIDVTGTTGNKIFAGSGQTYGALRMIASGTAALTITGANTFATLNVVGNRTVTLPAATTTTVTSALTLAGTSAALPLSLVSSAGASAATISAGGGVTVSATFLSLKDSTATGGATFDALMSSVVSNVSGWLVNTYFFADSALASDTARAGIAESRTSADSALASDTAHVPTQPAHASDSALASDVARFRGAIGFDSSASSSSESPVSTLSWSHTVSIDSDRILLVVVGLISPTGQSVASVSFGGVPLAPAVTEGTAPVRSEIWFLAAPASGTGTVLVTLTSAARLVGGSASYFNVRQGVPFRSFAVASAASSSISVPVASQVGDVVVDSLAIATRAPLTAGAGQNVWLNLGVSTFTEAASYALGSSPRTMTWSGSALANWAYAAASLEPLYRTAAVAADSALASDTATVHTQPAHSSDTALASDAPHVPTQPAHASDAALASDVARFRGQPVRASDACRTSDAVTEASVSSMSGDPARADDVAHPSAQPAHASDNAVTIDTGFRLVSFPRSTADSALAADTVARLLFLPRQVNDTAYAWDWTSDLEPIHARVTTTGVLGHAVFGWWVLGNKDAYVRGRIAADAATTTDAVTSTTILRPRGTTDLARAVDVALAATRPPRTTGDHALAADQASPFKVTLVSTVDSAAATDVATVGTRKPRTTVDHALAADAAHRVLPLPGQVFDAAEANDAATQRRGHAVATADAAATTDSATAVKGARLAQDRALALDRAAAVPGVQAADAALAVDAAKAARFRPALDSALASDRATGVVGPSAVATDAAHTTDAASAFRSVRRSASDSSLAGDLAFGGVPRARSTADVAATTDAVLRALARLATDSSLTSDTAVATRPAVRITTDVALTVDASAWVRSFPRTTADAAMAFDSATGGRLKRTSDVALSVDSAVVSVRLGRLEPDSAPAYDSVTVSLVVKPVLFTFGKVQPRWRFGRIVTQARRFRASDFAGRP